LLFSFIKSFALPSFLLARKNYNIMPLLLCQEILIAFWHDTK